MLHNYSEIYSFGHRYLADLLRESVVVEEKVDGSQFSFGVIGGALYCKSHNAKLNLDSPGMFKLAVDYVKTIQNKLVPEATYRGEFLSKPKHNTLTYGRVPLNNIIIYDIDLGDQKYVSPFKKKEMANDIGLEVVPQFDTNQCIISTEFLESLLEKESILGNTKIEGVVIKNYYRYGIDKKCLMGKFVSPKFKELHQTDWRGRNPTGKDIVALLGAELRTDARWNKAIQHLKEQELLVDAPEDIGKLLKEIQVDVEKECTDHIKEVLFDHFRKSLLRLATQGFPEYYKEMLSENLNTEVKEILKGTQDGV